MHSPRRRHEVQVLILVVWPVLVACSEVMLLFSACSRDRKSLLEGVRECDSSKVWSDDPKQNLFEKHDSNVILSYSFSQGVKEARA
jgi:hypothetical protein